jgi:membrane fusion protein (multidrug efflux system)
MHDVAKSISSVPVQSNVRPRRRRGLGVAIGLLVAIVVFVLGIKALQIGKMMSMPKMMPSVTVTSAPVKEEDWAPMLSAVGSVSAAQGAIVSAELAGVVSEINFENGSKAKKGEMLMKLDASQEEALMRSAEAEAQLARTALARSRDLAMTKPFQAPRSTLPNQNSRD